ncbi:Holliday junction branch migration protein RuvA [uncultured Lactobacillus sp.]|uniref:Holliday junction branch migration protein RuvA n=1 Tax=uncultured Lactobacillus sp. TaxID=153152 RepID=UPI0025DC3C2C|nr:Holliday junction branch migration protein RuvA [uncultured Lactobacillus sp.]
MYEYFEGTITVVNPAYVVIEVAGIGYRILTPTPYAYKEGDKARIYVEQVVRENGMTLYGFKSQQDKGLFNKLNEVSGIGPKSALAIMAAEDNGALASAIESGEASYLTRFPGIGKKTASQIVLDLRGKMGNYVAENLFNEDEPVKSVSPALEDALLALGSLGYSQKEVDRIKPKLEKLPEMSANEYIKQGLGFLLKK